MKHMIYLLIVTFFCGSLHCQHNTNSLSPQNTNRTIIHQKIDRTAETLELIDKKAEKIAHEITTSNNNIKSAQKNTNNDRYTIKKLKHTMHDSLKKFKKTQEKLCDIESTVEEIEEEIPSINNQVDITNSLLTQLCSCINIIQEPFSILEKACDIFSLTEIIEDTAFGIQSNIFSLFDITENERSRIDEIDSQEDIILSKVCDIASIVDNTSSLDNTSDFLSLIDTLNSKLDRLETTADSLLDKTCDILSISESIESKIDNTQMNAQSAQDTVNTACSTIMLLDSQLDGIEILEESLLAKTCQTLSIVESLHSGTDIGQTLLDSILDKTCDILSITEIIDSNLDQLDSTFETIESKVCRISTCDFIITQDDIGNGNVFTITQPGLYCLGENVSFSTGTAITVNPTDANDWVVIELCGRSIDGGNNAQTTAIRFDPTRGVIRNGFIQGVTTGIFVENSAGPVSIHNIEISDSIFNAQTDTPGEAGGIIFSNSSQGIVTQCQCTNVAPVAFQVHSNSSHCIFRECAAYNTSNAGFVISETSSCCIIQDCCAQTNDLSSTINYLFIDPNSALNITSSGGPGIGLFGTNGCVLNCQVIQHTSFIGDVLLGAIDIRNSNNTAINCKAHENIANLFGPGFTISGLNHLLRSCTASDNNTNGFVVGTTGQMGIADSAANCVFLDCIASGNTDDGFFIDTTLSGISEGGNIFKRNSSIGNGRHGFNASNTSAALNKFLSNTAEQNGQMGFSDTTNSANNYFNNCACENMGGNYSAIIELVQGPTDIVGFWVNMDCDSFVVGSLHEKLCSIQEMLNEFTA